MLSRLRGLRSSERSRSSGSLDADFTPRCSALRIGELWIDEAFDTIIKDSAGQTMTLNDVVMSTIRSHKLFAQEAMGKVTPGRRLEVDLRV